MNLAEGGRVMREILFKAKTKNADGTFDWVEGHLSMCNGKWIICDDEGAGDFIDPETICQYTGLKDKHGNKIWENDIVERNYTLYHGENKKTREMQINVVNYSNKSCCFMIGKKTYLVKPWDGDTLEVVGNIFDNAELLEE